MSHKSKVIPFLSSYQINLQFIRLEQVATLIIIKIWIIQITIFLQLILEKNFVLKHTDGKLFKSFICMNLSMRNFEFYVFDISNQKDRTAAQPNSV